ncbi:MAG: 23S rRNA (guanosine(2251)-2'-O)-methyltransferase RlmB [Hyphomicrobiales bacterium]|nr:23S rRNA (guanosine(2251)-2'-O)-methyltransferase RlmB [Hyphomicrobiales bacterium]
MKHSKRSRPHHGKHEKRPAPKHQNKNTNQLWLYGKHPVLAALANPARKIKRLCAASQSRELLPASLQHPVEEMSTHEIAQLLPEGAVHQGLALLTAPLPGPSLEAILAPEGQPQTLLILDQVTDPHNVGAILRTAAAFGVAAVIQPQDHAAQESGVLAKSASGALERVPLVRVTNLSATLEQLKKADFWCIGMDGEAEQTLEQLPRYARKVIVMGAEGKGLRRLTREHCDLLAAIPMTRAVESLNVSNAAAIALYALRD